MSILIVSFNTCEMTLACIDSVFRETQKHSFEVIVVDNASSDGSAEAIAEKYPQLRLIAPERNLGFAVANNLAAKEAQGDYILLLNPDTVVLNGAIDRLIEFANSAPEAKIWGGRTIYADGSLNKSSCWGKMTVWSLFCHAVGLRRVFRSSAIFNTEGYGNWQRDTMREVDVVTGCLFLIRRNFWRQLGGFRPRYFMYGEEADLCLRARAHGARPLIDPNVTIIHHGSASDPIQGEKRVGVLRAKVSLMQDHWSPLSCLVGKALLLFHTFMNMIMYQGLGWIARTSSVMEQNRSFAHVWKERGSWLAGYPDGESCTRPPSSSCVRDAVTFAEEAGTEGGAGEEHEANS